MRRPPEILAAAAASPPRRSLEITSTTPVQIGAAAAGEAGSSAALRRFSMLAYTGAAMVIPGYDRPVIVDLAGVEVPSQRRPVLRQHDATRIIGHTDAVEVGKSIKVGGVISGVGADAQEVIASADNGFPWQSSIGADPLEMETVDRGMTATVNGREFAGPAYVARRTLLKEISFVPIGADGGTSAVLAGGLPVKGASMSFEEWLVTLGFEDASKLSPVQMANLQQLYAEQGSGSEEEEEEEETTTTPADPPATAADNDDEEEEEDTMSAEAVQARIRAAAAGEETRQHHIRTLCAGANNPTLTVNGRANVPLSAHAIAANWTPERTELELLRRQRETAGPFIAAHSHDTNATLQALQGAMILRANGRLDHPAYQRPQALAMGLPTWLRAGINAEQQQRAMEAAHHYRDLSLVDLCREAVRLDGRSAPHGRTAVIQAAFSGSALTNIFTTNINAILLATYLEHPDTTQGWVRETEANDFRPMDRLRLTKGGRLRKLPRGQTATHEDRADTKETYSIARYAKQFVVDDQDVIDDYFGALADMPVEMGNGAARLRPDLVYSILKANAALASGVTLFHNGTHANTDTGAALAASTLKAGVTAIRKQRENSVNLNLAPTHLVVPQVLEFTARELAQSTVMIIAGTAGTVTERGALNTIQSVGLQVVADSRLDNGVIDPATETSYDGDANDWFLAAASAYGIEVAYLRGTGRSPQVRSFMLERGQWGVGWDIAHDVGAKALDYKGLYRGQG